MSLGPLTVMKHTLAMCKCRRKMLLCTTFVIVTAGEVLEWVLGGKLDFNISFHSFFADLVLARILRLFSCCCWISSIVMVEQCW